MVDRFQAELGECTVIATGGLADTILPFEKLDAVAGELRSADDHNSDAIKSDISKLTMLVGELRGRDASDELVLDQLELEVA